MDLALNNGFCEMNDLEVICVDGGVNWGTALTGAGLVVTCIGITLATGGIGVCSVPLILGAGTASEIAVAGVACVGSAIGGATVGYGLSH